MKKEHYKILIDKYFDDALTPGELQELIDWIKNDVRLSDWWQAEFDRADAFIDTALRDRMFSKIRTEIFATDAPMTESLGSPTATQPTLQPTTAKRRWGWGQWAAAILLPLCIGLLGYNLLQGRMNHISTLIVQADRGDKATVVLPDGTSVILNSSSQLDYYSDFGRKERRVKLEGEGYFDVSRDEAHAFVVQVGELEVKVLGTIFNVSAYSDANEVSVVLLEGKVEVCTPNTNNIMQPNERLTYNRETNKITTQKVYGTDYVTWTKGNLYFENETLQNIMQTLSRKYDVNIYIDSSAIVNDRFTGTIPDGGIQNALNILKWTSSFDYELKDSVIVIREK